MQIRFLEWDFKTAVEFKICEMEKVNEEKNMQIVFINKNFRQHKINFSLIETLN